MTAHIPPPPIVSADWLAAALAAAATGGGRAVVVADVRFYLDGRDGRAAYREAHIPGAVFIDLDTVLAAAGTPAAGRHPLPRPEVFAAGLGAAGIGDDTVVVAYDDLGGMVAARLVWMLRITGFPAALLDGGLQAWPEETASGEEVPVAVARTTRPWPDGALATAGQVAEHLAAGGVVVDSRAPERYRGETEPVDSRAGHIPGARNAPFADNLDDRGRFLSPTDLARRFAAIGADADAVFYCGSGVSACHNLLAMEASGRGLPRLYPGSWSQWSADPDRPVATAGPA